jgi:glutathione S-transferase
VAFKGLPPILSWALPRLIRRGVIKALFAQGLGRHSRSEALAIARKDMAALSEILGAGPYFFGATPCSLDVIAFGVFGTLLANQRETCPLRALASEFPNLVAHCQRLRELAWDRAAAA